MSGLQPGPILGARAKTTATKAEARTGESRFARCARNDSQKGKSKSKSKGNGRGKGKGLAVENHGAACGCWLGGGSFGFALRAALRMTVLWQAGSSRCAQDDSFVAGRPFDCALRLG